ncbi:MAG: FadR family transcriptional regulator [Deltaproteobacteria bacterium]|nr:FadR family transcriptional regulator [Deltaproteobacteria bacterium]
MSQDAPEPIARTSLIETLRKKLQEDILSGRYPAGTSLPPERELAARYGVTRTSLKHALIELRSFGLIAIRHGIGSIVEDVAARAGADALQYMAQREGGWDLRLFVDLLEARALIGGLFGRVAASRRTEADVESLREALGGARRTSRDPHGLQVAENLFMRRVTETTHVRTFVFLSNSISAVYARTLDAFGGAFEDGDWVTGSLEEIFDEIRDGSSAGAESAMERYLTESGKRMIAALEEQSP